MYTADQTSQCMFVVCSRKMQEAQRLCDSLALLLLLGSWFVADINSYPMSFEHNPWMQPPPSSHSGTTGMMQTRKTASGISYRFDTWSQYENPEEGAEEEGDIHVSHSRKTITRNKRLLWPNGVVNYYYHSSLVNEPTKLAKVESAMDEIMSKTCIKFVRIYPDKYGKFPKNNWVNITGHRMGCFSDLGRNTIGSSTLNLNVNGCLYTSAHAIHELLHTLGVFHEHMRPDRDEYITIVWENIHEEHSHNFRLLSDNVVTDYGLPYDYDSIMHYSMTAFSKDRRNLPTIIPKSPNVEIGQRNHMSHYDIQKLLITYNCTKNTINKKKKQKKYKKFIDLIKFSTPSEITSKNETEVETKPQSITIHNTITNKLENNKCVNSKEPVEQSNHMAIPKIMYPIQANYRPMPLTLINPYVHFHFYFDKKFDDTK